MTYDVNETIRLRDKIATSQEGGVLAQFDTPDRILVHPVGELIHRFIDPGPNLKRLGMIQVGQLPRHDVPLPDEALTPIAGAHPPLAGLLHLVLNCQRHSLHWFGPQRDPILPVERPLASNHSLRFAYNTLLDVATGVLVHVDGGGQYRGAVSHTLLQQVLGDAMRVRSHDWLELGYR